MTRNSASVGAAPFLRWAGSKRWLVPTLRDLLPVRFGSYYEPFLGSGAAFFAVAHGHRAVLSDTIGPLINTYQQVRDVPDLVSKRVAEWATDSDAYYEVRSLDPDGDPVLAAARFIYLNRLCFNGLYRENRSGGFNVPYGRPKTSNMVSEHQLRAASNMLNNDVHISIRDFDDALKDCEPGDLVYLDPPYVAGHRSNNFVDYNAQIFKWADQERLADTFRILDAMGVYVLLSNADHETIRMLYPDSSIRPVSRFSSMSARASNRGISGEILVIGNTLERALS